MKVFFAHTHDLLIKGGAAVIGFLHGMTSGDNRAAMLLAAIMVADYISGVVAAGMGKSKKSTGGRLSSQAGAKGILRKAMMLMVVVLAYLLDLFANEGNSMFASAAIWFYISNEGLSLIENLLLCGVPVPAKIRNMLEQISVEEKDPQALSGEQTDAADRAEDQNEGNG